MKSECPITNNQAPINHQYPISNNQTGFFCTASCLGIRSLVIGYYLVIGAWLLIILCMAGKRDKKRIAGFAGGVDRVKRLCVYHKIAGGVL